jgi:hypothetical protein
MSYKFLLSCNQLYIFLRMGCESTKDIVPPNDLEIESNNYLVTKGYDKKSAK